MQRILVTGARAKTGAPLIDLLTRESDVEVLAGSRDPAKLDLDHAEAVTFGHAPTCPCRAAFRSRPRLFLR